jgi:DNA helicase-2/ATP-dependent DNA helicase PcrA
VARLARLIECGVTPDRLLLVTFSRRASQEMIRRLSALVGSGSARLVPAGTFHALALRVIRRQAGAFGLEGGFTVIDRGDATELMHLARGSVDIGTELRDRRFPRKETLVSCYSRVANSQRPLGEVLRRHYPWVQEHEQAIAGVFGAYAERKRAGGLLDFDDLLLYWRAASADPVLGPALASVVDHVLVDEYQDTNLIQSDIVRSMSRHGCAVTAVGDDAQSIYGFRAANLANMLDFAEHFPGAAQVTLEQNYRSTQPILDLANGVLRDAEQGYAKRLWSETQGGGRPQMATCSDEGVEAEAVADVVLEHHERGVALRDQAVLFRSAHHSDLVELELRRRGIPFVKYGGLRFLEAAHVRDLLAALRVLDNPRDELAWHRMFLLLEGVGPASARRMIEDLEFGGGGATLGGAIALLSSARPPLPGRAADQAAALARALEECSAPGLAPGVQIERLRRGLDPLLRHRYADAEVRLRDLDALTGLAGTYGTISELICDLALDPPSSTSDLAGPPTLDDDYLILSTVHSAKGGEWRVVHLIHVVDGMFPSDLATGAREEVEEERRLFYVALTRAREHLHIYAPLRLHQGHQAGRGDRHGYAQRSRFLHRGLSGLIEERPVRTRAADLCLPEASHREIGSAVEEALRALW